MPNKCGVVNCNGNYNKKNRCRVFRLPKDRYERQKWIDALPPRKNFDADCDRFFICEKHWGPNPPSIKLPGGYTRPAIPPSVFNVPASCLPSSKPVPRPAKAEDQQRRHFLQKDTITSFDAFRPERDLQKQYKNLIISRSEERLVCLIMTENFSECSLSVIVENTPTLCSPLICRAFKKGISVPLGKTLHPNSGLRSYGQFAETVRLAINYDIPFDKMIENVVTLLQTLTSACVNTENEKKLVFLTRQLELLSQKQFSVNDYCFALESYPKCSYEQLRDFLVLPSKRKLQYITSSIDKDQVMRETFAKVKTLQQKNVFLSIDEVQIRPASLIDRCSLNIDGMKSSGTISNMPSISAGTSTCTSAAVTSPGTSSMHSIGQEFIFDDEEDVEMDIKEEEVDDGNFVDIDAISKTKSTTLQSSEEPNIFATFDDEEKKSSLSCTSSSLVSDPLHIKESTIIKSEDHDEYHLFGMFVASQLRALSQHDAIQAQVEIQTILSKKRFNSIT